MADYFEIRADYNQHTITVYQAYNDAIADVAVRDGRFDAPFSFNRMTWIKPSFMWMMERSNWGLKKDQQRILAIRIKRTFFDTLLEQAVLTTRKPMSTHMQEFGKRYLRKQMYMFSGTQNAA